LTLPWDPGKQTGTLYQHRKIMAQKQSKSRSLLIAAVAIAAIVGGAHLLGFYNVMSIQGGMIMYMAAKSAQTSTNVAISTLYGQIEHFSAFIVETPEIRQLIEEAERISATHGVESPESVETRALLRTRSRELFFDKVPQLAYLHVSFFVGEKSELFLQLNPPGTPETAGRGGDSLPRLAASQRRTVRGFYADAAYAGLRCAAPLLFFDRDQGESRCIGVVEIGVDFEALLHKLMEAALSDKQRPGCFAALLKKDRAERAFSPERLATLPKVVLANGEHYMLAQTSFGSEILPTPQDLSKLSPVKDVVAAFHKEMFPELAPEPKNNWLRRTFGVASFFDKDSAGAASSAIVDGVPLGIIAFQLDEDLLSSSLPSENWRQDDALRAEDAPLLAWASFPDIVTLYERLLVKTVIQSLSVYLLLLAVFYATWRFASRKLRRIIEQRTSELAAAEQRYRGIYENAVQGMFQSKPEGRYLSVNPAFSAMLGYTQQEMLDARETRDILSEDPEQMEILRKLLQKGGVLKNHPLRLKRKDGTLIHALFNARAVRDADGELVFEGIVIDDSARKNAEERLKKSEETYRRILETASEGFLLMDTEFHILDVNEAFVRMLSFERDELLGKQPVEFGAKETRDYIIKNMKELRGAPYRSFEGAYLDKNGRKLPVLVNSNALRNDRDEIIGQVAFISDISDRKRAEALREDVERMARHDLKTPLNAVINLPQVVLADENLPEEHAECMRMIQDAGYRMLDMINLSLNLYRMECGTYQFTPRPVDLLPLLRRVIVDLQSLASAKAVPVRLLVGEELADGASCSLSCVVRGEELLCYSMFANLIKNAIEATPDGGRPVTVLCFQGSEQRVSIHNQGVISAEMKDKFFVKYATAGKQGGAGLGAYSAWLIAKTHNARIAVSSSEQEGVTVSVTFAADNA
jgi:PAS domain S-box-containing protein